MEKENTDIEFQNRGLLQGHNGWVTSIVSGNAKKDEEETKMLISASRDRSIIVWSLNLDAKSDDQLFGQPHKQLFGHDHFINDLALSNDNLWALSASWDNTMRLWELRQGKVAHKFLGHTKEVFSCCFSPDCRIILSGGCEKNIKLWNVKGTCKWTITQNNHSDWVSRVRYSPDQRLEYFATVGWDGRLKIWNKNFLIKYTFVAHDGAINALSISPIGRYIATGGKDQQVKVWDITDLSKPIVAFKAKSEINDIKFNPSNQWLAAATNKGISVWDLQNEGGKPFRQLEHHTTRVQSQGKNKGVQNERCTSLEWNAQGSRLFGGFADGAIRVWDVQQVAIQEQQ